LGRSPVVWKLPDSLPDAASLYLRLAETRENCIKRKELR